MKDFHYKIPQDHVGPKAHHSIFDDDTHVVIILMILCLFSLQIFDQDLSRRVVSTKDLKSSFGASTV